jgi:tRNA (mo5U34)-methyltransferase
MQISDPFSYVQRWERKRREGGWWHSFELPDGQMIHGVSQLADQRDRIGRFPIAQDLRGKRVLDIGAWDGWFSFEMERRGAEVTAIDVWDNPRFREMRALLGSRVEYLRMDVYDLDPARMGQFDIVLFMGVLYHLKHPLLALERVCSVTREMAAVDSFVLREEHRPGAGVDNRPVMEFYETSEFGGQTDNWCGPSVDCLRAFCRTAGFARAELMAILQHSACFACYRRWEEPVEPSAAAPELIDVFHNTDFGLNCDWRRDDYLSCWFRCAATQLGLDDVKPEVAGLGVRPIHVAPEENYWQVNFKVPPGLPAGWRDVALRIGDGPPSNALPVAVGMPLAESQPAIRGVRDGVTWKPDEVDLSAGDRLALWVSGLPENADRHNTCAMVDGEPAEVVWVERGREEPARQVNVCVPETIAAGSAKVWLEIGAGRSEPVRVRVRR